MQTQLEMEITWKLFPFGGMKNQISGVWVEVKTISPEKCNDKVTVKRAGNFNKLLVVKINADFSFESKMIDRKLLAKGSGKHASYTWGAEATK